MPDPLPLDRMQIEEAGPDPVAIAAALHAQLPDLGGAVPIERIARSLDIVEVRKRPLRSFAGALVMLQNRNRGSIVVDSCARPQRRRFTIAHELGHYLMLHHQPAQPGGGFVCTTADLSTFESLPGVNQQRSRQEIEANRFAIEVLAPRSIMIGFVTGPPDLSCAVALASTLELSREAAARRYGECHPAPLGLIFGHNGLVRYAVQYGAFPWLGLKAGDRLSPSLPLPVALGVGPMQEIDCRALPFRTRTTKPLFAQTLRQDGGYTITLLTQDPSVSASCADIELPF